MVMGVRTVSVSNVKDCFLFFTSHALIGAGDIIFYMLENYFFVDIAYWQIQALSLKLPMHLPFPSKVHKI